MARNVVKECRALGDVDLDQHRADETFGWDKDDAKAEFIDEIEAVSQLQTRLFAAQSHAVLVVLQAVDAGGKGGTVRSVMNGMNPAGIDVNGFGVPSDAELSHDYLWRIHAHTPPKGTIGIFDRSHYEDVLVVRVKHLVSEEVWRRRYGHIRDFERMLGDEGTSVIKIYLNVSKEEQRERLQDRIDDPTERWKFRLGDLDDRALWDDYRVAFTDAIEETTTDEAPWYIVPGDRKWVRNLVVARILRHHLEEIDPRFPPPEPGIDDVVVQ